ncbi:MAG TPA: cytochrome P450 [Trebonia sp.]
MPATPIPLGQEFYQQPHALYRRLAAAGPALPVITPDGLPGWLVTSYREGRALLADPRLSKDLAKIREALPADRVGAFASPLMKNMVFSDPPEHTRLRGLVNRAFTGHAVKRLRPRIARVADELLDALAAEASSGESVVDLITGYARPLAVAVISELLGVPAADRSDFREWTMNLFFRVGTPAEVAASAARTSEYLGALIAARRAEPRDDLLSELAQVPEGEGGLTHGESLSMAQVLLAAGFETSVNLIGNGILALLRSPGQLAVLRSDPSLIPGAVEEFLRYDSPAHLATLRVTTEAVPVGNVEIPPGQLVFISLLAANRDSDRFPEPDRLDVTRQPGGHMAFGHGIHHCVGAPLARLEGQIAFERLLSRFPDLALAEPTALSWGNSALMHGLQSLPVRPTAAA